jgi:hypothetical protein
LTSENRRKPPDNKGVPGTPLVTVPEKLAWPRPEHVHDEKSQFNGDKCSLVVGKVEFEQLLNRAGSDQPMRRELLQDV